MTGAVGGLLGADFFSSYLLDLNLPKATLRLSPLPKRPEPSTVTAIVSAPQAPDNVPHDDVPEEWYQPPLDRYVAPEMKDWTPFFRFGHMILVPTRLNHSKPILFLVDTGAMNNTISIRAAKSVSKVDATDALIQGVSGYVSDVARVEKVDIEFGRFHQPGINLTTFDLSDVSRSAGTEVSGLFGFNLLSLLEIKIDYRDGLVDFIYRVVVF